MLLSIISNIFSFGIPIVKEIDSIINSNWSLSFGNSAGMISTLYWGSLSAIIFPDASNIFPLDTSDWITVKYSPLDRVGIGTGLMNWIFIIPE